MTDTDQTPADDFGRRLDAAVGHPPTLASPAQRVALGRRALRRRRGAQGLAALAALAVVGSGATWAAGLGDDDAIDAADSEAAPVDPCPVLPSMSPADAAALPDAEPTVPVRPFGVNDPVYYDDVADSFGYRDGLRGVEHLTGELTRAGHPPTRWDAVELEGTNGPYYGLVTFTRNLGPGGGGGGSSVYDEVTAQRPSLAQWTAFNLAVRPGSAQDVVALDDTGQIVASDGFTVVQQIEADDTDGFSRNDEIRLAAIRRDDDFCWVIADSSSAASQPSTTIYLVAPEYGRAETLAEFGSTVSDVRGDG